MTIFGAIGVAGTGMTVTRKWRDAVGDNIANANTVTAPRASGASRARPGAASSYGEIHSPS